MDMGMETFTQRWIKYKRTGRIDHAGKQTETDRVNNVRVTLCPECEHEVPGDIGQFKAHIPSDFSRHGSLQSDGAIGTAFEQNGIAHQLPSTAVVHPEDQGQPVSPRGQTGHWETRPIRSSSDDTRELISPPTSVAQDHARNFTPPTPLRLRARHSKAAFEKDRDFHQGNPGRRLWDNEPRPSPYVHHQTGRDQARSSAASAHLQSHPEPSSMIREPGTRPIAPEQLVSEVIGIYDGLKMVESKSIETTVKLDGYSKFLGRGRMFNVDCTFNGVQLEANADTGASANVMSMTLATSMGLIPEPGTGGSISLPSGKRITSPGRVKGFFKFGEEEKTHDVSCIVLEHSSHAFVLGSKFLRLTRTFTKHMHRLKRVFAGATGTVLNLLGDEQEAISGYLNGSRCLGVPDSGSDIMVVSGAYAKAHGLKIHRGRRDRHMMEFIDGSKELTDGLVENLAWQFRVGERPIICNFHVINNLPFDAILSNALIDEFDVFSTYEDLLLQAVSVEAMPGIYNIRLAERCQAEITDLEDSFIQDMTSDTPFTAAIIEREGARRDMIRDRIAGLLESKRQAQRDCELRRQARFNEEWAKHRDRMAKSSQQSRADAASSPRQANAYYNVPHSSGLSANRANNGTDPVPSGGRRKLWSGWKRWR